MSTEPKDHSDANVSDSTSQDASRFDLTERTAMLGERVVRFAKLIPQSSVTRPLISQLVRAGTSVGANYVEADESGSRNEFRYRVSLCKRECRETQHWLRMVAAAVPEKKSESRELSREDRELVLIFSAIYRRSKPGPASVDVESKTEAE